MQQNANHKTQFMFRHRNAIFRESTETKIYKHNTTLQVLTALTVTFKILNR
jgi:hypothetical protein